MPFRVDGWAEDEAPLISLSLFFLRVNLDGIKVGKCRPVLYVGESESHALEISFEKVRMVRN